jgi:hypothetical protein
MKNLMVIAIAAVLMAVGHSARAIIVVMDGTNSYSGINATTGLPDPSYQLTIAYEVTETTGNNPYSGNIPYYTYDYTLTTTPSEDLTSFTIGGNSDPINTATINLFPFNYGVAIPAASGFNLDSVGWDWGFSSGITSDTVGFSSEIAPSLAAYTANDDGIDWSSPALIPAPVPEPSSVALLAGAVMVVGFFKYRRPAKLQVQEICDRH